LRARFADDAAAIEQLARLERGVVLETTGDPYDWPGRVATFTGFPAVVGWSHHEAGWRNTWAPIEGRVRDVHRAYESGSLAVLSEIVQRYDVRWIVVGDLERRRYPPESLAVIADLPATVRVGATTIHDARSLQRESDG